MARSKNLLLVLACFVLHVSYTFAQQNKYFVYFTDKSNSPYSISDPSQFLSQRALERRARYHIGITSQDLPVNPGYLNSIQATGAQVLSSSRWFNGALVYATAAQMNAIRNLSFVSALDKATRKGKMEKAEETLAVNQGLQHNDYGSSFSQVAILGADVMHEKGFQGKGALIALIDGGFQNANALPVFDSLFMNNRILSTYDFVDNEENVYNDHEHGTMVLSVLGGYLPGSLIGTAWQADYLLLRSEDASTESLSEEYNWVRAVEYADSAGADIVSSSLGYALFDDPSTSHTYADLNGDASVITRAADIAASKGMLVVTGAGNEGNDPWKYLLMPADGDSVLAIGATDAQGNHSSYSSIGPLSGGRIKPDLCAQGTLVTIVQGSGGVINSNGTSFAAPLVSGLAAGIWQQFPYLSNMDLIYYLHRSASQYTNPDFECGYGIPNYSIAEGLILEHSIDKISIMPNPVENENVVVAIPPGMSGQHFLVTLYDRMGRLISMEDIHDSVLRNELRTDFSKLATGLYILRISGNAGDFTYKIVKI